jgi:hypothetical protein
LCAPAALVAQSLEARINDLPANASVRFSFPSRANVCGDGENLMIVDSTGQTRMSRGVYRRNDSRFDEQGRLRDCRRGPVVVDLTRQGGAITNARVSVGGNSAAAGSDLGTIDAAAAVEWLLAANTLTATENRAAGDLIFAATLSTAQSWPALLRVARERTIPESARSTAILWLSQQAGDRAVAGLQSILGDDSEELDVKQSALIALSRIPGEDAVPMLINVARTHREPDIRRMSLMLLGRTGDPRALQLFEEILTGRK